MKKQYIKPVTEGVNVALYGSVLDAPDMPWVPGSPVTEVIDAKENNLLFEDDDSFGDIWGDPNAGSDPYDLWGDN
jgi:hypothetical protein